MAGSTGIVDWALAERVARIAADRAAPITSPVRVDVQARVAEIEDRIADTTGLRSLAGQATVQLIDRSQWIAANIASFQHLLRPLLDRADGRMPAIGRAVARKMTGTEIGLMLGWMSTRVLGQYDLLVGRDPDTDHEPDAVYLVQPNIAALERRFGLDPTGFRTWVLIHELTHRAQFTGVPWMRPYFVGLVERSLALADSSPDAVLGALRSAVRDRDGTRQRLREHGLVGVIATPEQRQVIASISGLMSLLEGHGDVVMSRAAGPLVPDTERFERIMQARRQRGNPLTRFIQRLTGVEAKLNQYAAGARFIAEVEATGGERVIDACWRSPDDLPTMDEIREPRRWLARVSGVGAVAETGG